MDDVLGCLALLQNRKRSLSLAVLYTMAPSELGRRYILYIFEQFTYTDRLRVAETR